MPDRPALLASIVCARVALSLDVFGVRLAAKQLLPGVGRRGIRQIADLDDAALERLRMILDALVEGSRRVVAA